MKRRYTIKHDYTHQQRAIDLTEWILLSLIIAIGVVAASVAFHGLLVIHP